MRKKTKSVKTYLESIKDPEIRSKALANLEPQFAYQPAKNLAEAVSTAFMFDEAPEGMNYWSDVYFRILNGEKI